MTCLACGGTTAQDEWASPHELAGLLCLTHLAAALEADNRPLSKPSGSGIVPQSLHSRTCSGAVGTCPRPVVIHYLNASWCQLCAPAPRPAPSPVLVAKAAQLVDDGMVAAVLALLEIGSVIRVHAHAYGTSDDYWR